MNVLALIEADDHVCYRYRIEPFAWALAERGLELTAALLARSTSRRIEQFLGTRRYDAVWLQRRLPAVWQTAMLRCCAKRLIFDFDDAIYQRDSYSGKIPKSAQRLLRFWAVSQAADLIFAGNAYLASWARRFAAAECVEVVPTCVDLRHYCVADHRGTVADVRLVWIGSSSMTPSLNEAEDRLSAVGQRVPGISLTMICDLPIFLPNMPVRFVRWAKHSETTDLAVCDIGVSWLSDDDWSRGKCGLKVLQYMAAGLPVVANRVGMHLELVRHGETGFLADTPREWADAVERLAGDAKLRRQMGAAAREFVRHHYSVQAWRGRIADRIVSVVTGDPKPATNCPRALGIELEESVDQAVPTGEVAA